MRRQQLERREQEGQRLSWDMETAPEQVEWFGWQSPHRCFPRDGWKANFTDDGGFVAVKPSNFSLDARRSCNDRSVCFVESHPGSSQEASIPVIPQIPRQKV